jgi:HK97 family phage prohead protease
MPKEIRASAQPLQSENGGKTVAGYAAVFNSPTSICDMWSEVIEPGAFTDTLRSNQDVLALYSHELERLLGRESAGTLRLKEDETGLAVEIDLPDTSDGRDVGVLISRGDLKGMSFGFCVTKQEWDETVTPPKRTIMAWICTRSRSPLIRPIRTRRSAWPSWRKRAAVVRSATRKPLRCGSRPAGQSPNRNSAASAADTSRAGSASPSKRRLGNAISTRMDK